MKATSAAAIPKKDALLQIAECAQTGELKSIFEVPAGAACRCVLPGTDVPLIAKNKGKFPGQALEKGQRQAHFAYTAGSNPQRALESAIHKLAKTVFHQRRRLHLPHIEPYWEWDIELDESLSRVIPIELPADQITYYLEQGIKLANEKLAEKFAGGVHEFGDVQLELRLTSDAGTIIADAVGYNKGATKMLVEFCFTHAVDAEKVEVLKTMNRSCVEVDLSGFEQLDADGKPNKAGMIEGLEGPYPFAMKWVWNAKQERLARGVIEKVARNIGHRARKQLAKYLRERDPAFLQSRLDRGYRQLQVYHFRKGPDKVYCPQQAGDPVALSTCRNCLFFGMHHCVSKSDDVRADQAPHVADRPEAVSVLCGHPAGLTKADLKVVSRDDLAVVAR